MLTYHVPIRAYFPRSEGIDDITFKAEMGFDTGSSDLLVFAHGVC